MISTTIEKRQMRSKMSETGTFSDSSRERGRCPGALSAKIGRPMIHRFADDRSSVYKFIDEILVVCPRCGACARSARLSAEPRDWFAPRRLTCRCGYSNHWAGRGIAWDWWRSPTDGYFRCPLWLQVRIRGRLLWAFNAHHLDALEQIVRAKLRERAVEAPFGYRGTLLTTLPAWIKAADSREPVLRAISKMRATITPS